MKSGYPFNFADAGFTMIEVLVAMAILAISLTGIYRLHSQTLLMSARSRFYSTAQSLAQEKLAEIESRGIKDAADGSGDFGRDFEGYSWTVRIESMPSELLKDKAYHMVRIEVTITGADQETYNVRTYRYYSD